MKVLINNGHNCYIVGGAVRNSLLSIPVTDYDLTTSATPDEIFNVFKDYKLHTVGIKHGTVIVSYGGEQFEITTMRQDGEYNDYRHPDNVYFTTELKTDLGRRDFSVNAMACSLDGKIYDYFGGKNDIRNRIIRCVGSPDKRFKEDPLRILRAIRFAAEYGFTIEEETCKGLFKHSVLLEKISPERIRDEFIKLISAKNGGEIINEYYKIISVFIPEIESCKNFDQKSKYHKYDVLTHISRTMAEVAGDKILSLAMFFHDMGKPFSYTEENGQRHFKGHGEYSREIAIRTMEKLRFDKETIQRVDFLVKYHDYPITAEQLNPKGIRRLLSKFNLEGLRLLCLVHKADDMAKADFVKERIDIYNQAFSLALQMSESDECYSLKNLAIKGNDITEKGFSGKTVGEILNTLLNEVIEGNLQNKRDILLKYIDINSKMW